MTVQSQQFISELTINSALRSVEQAHHLEDKAIYMFTPGSVTSAFVNELFPNYEQIFGEFDDIDAAVLVKEAPVVNLRSEGSTAEISVWFIINNPFKDGIFSVSFEGYLSGDLDVWLRP